MPDLRTGGFFFFLLDAASKVEGVFDNFGLFCFFFVLSEERAKSPLLSSSASSAERLAGFVSVWNFRFSNGSPLSLPSTPRDAATLSLGCSVELRVVCCGIDAFRSPLSIPVW